MLALKPAAVAPGFKVHVLLLLRAYLECGRACSAQHAQHRRTGRSFTGIWQAMQPSLVEASSVFGRRAAALFSIESQKAGALHVHGHIAVEGLQQIATLQEIGRKVDTTGK